ncbi:MAG: S49 family peptidase [Alphaproteobacteria bacterium]|nr:S49 family peptidase [Alphaproteobacteria bacterium]
MKKNFRQHRPLFTPPSSQKPKIKWRILPIIWLALKRTAMALGFLMLINAVIAVVILSSARKGAHEVPMLPQKDIVLYMGFEDGFQELPKEISFLDGFEEPSLTVNEIVDTLDHAARDPRVTGLVARMRGGSFGLSATQDVRAALKRFREAGKFAYIYSSSYGDGGGGLGRYYLASAFDEIWMQPLGVVSVAGISAEMPFMREGLDKLGIRPQFFQRKDYKTAYESLTNKSISPENKEMTRQLINDIRSVILADVPADRGMSPAAFEKLVDKGLLTAKEAQEAGLVTHVDYGDVLLEKVAEEVTGEPKAENLDLVYMEDYRDGIASEIHKGRKGKVALIYALGAIVPSADGGGAFDGGSHVAAADEIAPAILNASRDNKV